MAIPIFVESLSPPSPLSRATSWSVRLMISEASSCGWLLGRRGIYERMHVWAGQFMDEGMC